jgi:hypothetical protein
MQQDDEYEEEEEAQVHDNNNVAKNQKGASPSKGKTVKTQSKSPIPDKKTTGIKKEEKKSVIQQVNNLII